MKLQEISFPVYKLAEYRPSIENGVVYYNTKKGIEIVDIPSVPGESLTARRLALLGDGQTLYTRMHAIYFIGDLVRSSKTSTWFIDSTGKIFQHKKSTMVEIVCKPIESIIKINGGVLIEVAGIPSRLMALYPPTDLQKYASLIKNGHSFIFYGYTKDWHSSIKRKI